MAFYHGQKRNHHYSVDLINTRTGAVSVMNYSQWTTKREAIEATKKLNKVASAVALGRKAVYRKVNHYKVK